MTWCSHGSGEFHPALKGFHGSDVPSELSMTSEVDWKEVGEVLLGILVLLALYLGRKKWK